MNSTLGTLTEFALELAWHAGRITLGYFQTGVETEYKADASPVTRADRHAEKYLRGAIQACFPNDGLIGEEFGRKEGTTSRTWIIDPIDGTRSFVCGVPLYGVLIGIEIEGEATVGVIHFPALAETVWATKGGGCYWNGRKAQVSSVENLSEALLSSSDIPAPGGPEADWAERYGRLLAVTKIHRTWGDCYGYALVATGRAEVMVDPVMNVWDTAPLKPIVEEAGGHFTDLNGEPTIWGGSALATNGRLHEAVLAVVNG